MPRKKVKINFSLATKCQLAKLIGGTVYEGNIMSADGRHMIPVRIALHTLRALRRRHRKDRSRALAALFR
jgi:hypothetical protein